LVVFLWTWVVKATHRLQAMALGLIIGGALGNVVDRVWHGAVMDFLHFHWGNWSWYIFNFADVGIVAGVALLLYDSFTEARANQRHGNA
jgi:signal peptidase II